MVHPDKQRIHGLSKDDSTLLTNIINNASDFLEARRRFPGLQTTWPQFEAKYQQLNALHAAEKGDDFRRAWPSYEEARTAVEDFIGDYSTAWAGYRQIVIDFDLSPALQRYAALNDSLLQSRNASMHLLEHIVTYDDCMFAKRTESNQMHFNATQASDRWDAASRS